MCRFLGPYDLSVTASRFCIRCGEALVQPADLELKPACPTCGWFLATSTLPVALVLAHSPSGRIVYTRQAGWPDKAWGLVSGFVEPGETAEVAALRELREETGLVGREPRVLRTLSYGDLVLIVVDVGIDDGVLRAASDVESAVLREPDLALTPADWPAHSVVAEYILRGREGTLRPN